jgi:hypothetical protein
MFQQQPINTVRPVCPPSSRAYFKYPRRGPTGKGTPGYRYDTGRSIRIRPLRVVVTVNLLSFSLSTRQSVV